MSSSAINSVSHCINSVAPRRELSGCVLIKQESQWGIALKRNTGGRESFLIQINKHNKNQRVWKK